MANKINTTDMPRKLFIVSTLSGAMITLLSCMVLAAWDLHLTTILQINPSYVPMQFNTALAFLCAGAGLCLASIGALKYAALLGSVSGLLGLLTGIEYVFGVSLGIDDLFIRTYIMTNIRFPGRMAPSAAFCFALYSIAMWLALRASKSEKWSASGLIASLIASLGFISVLGYFTNLPVTYVWGNFSSMALHTALAFVFLGIGLIAFVFRREALRHIDPGYWRAGAVALVTLTIFIGVTQAMLAAEENALQSKAEVVAQAENAQVHNTLQLHMQAIERMAERSEIRLPSELEWRADASRYIQHANGTYDSIAWLSPAFQLRWREALDSNAPDTLQPGDLSVLFNAAKASNQVRLVRTISANDGKSSYLILAPIYVTGKLAGVIVAVIDPHKLFEKMSMITEKPYEYTVQNGSEILYSSQKHAVVKAPWVRSVTGSSGEVEWEIRVWPVDSSYSSAPWFVLLAGVLSASALAILALKSQAVRARLRELLTIIETAPIGMLVLDGDGLVRQMNQEAEKLFGFALDEVRGAQVNRMIPDVLGRELSRYSNSFIGKPTLCKRKDGSEVFTEVGINHILINGKEHILVVVTDISQRKRAEAELQAKSSDLMRSNKELVQLQLLLQTTIDHMPALVGSWDLGFRNRFGNKAYVDWFGMTPEQMRGKPMWEIIGQDRFNQLKPRLLSVLQGNTEVFERTITFPSGEIRHGVFSYVPDIENGVVNGYYGFVSDVTLLKQAQIAKDNVLAQLQDIIDAAKDFAIIETDVSGTITLFSRGAEILLGYSAQEIVGIANIDLFHLPVGQDARRELLEPQAATGFNALAELVQVSGSSSLDWNYLHKDGTPLLVNLTVATVHDKSGNITGYLGIAKDIRKEREILQALADARDKAQSANLAKSQFLANMSHEIRTPMNAILGMVQLLQHTNLTSRQLDYANKTQSAAQALLGLLNDILDFSKVEAGKLTLEHLPFNLDTLMRDLSVIFSSNIGAKDIEVLFSIDPALPAMVVGDQMRLRQVLINLAGNAIKFTHKGSVIISMEVVTREENRSAICFAIDDTGIGIGPEQLHYIFEGFSQAEASTTRRYGGTGLGLAISQRLVALMGGRLQVTSTVNQGSRFYFTLMLEHAVLQRSGPGLQQYQQKRRVLIVDDNAAAREVLQSMVNSLGWYSDAAENGQAALDLLQRGEAQNAPYDVVFMDWKMPGMDGVETASRMRDFKRSNGEAIIIIMVSAHDREVLAKELKHDQTLLNGFLVKPVTASMLFDAVANAKKDAIPMQTRSLRLDGLKLLVVEDNLINQEVARELLKSEGAQVEVASDGREGVDRLLAGGTEFDAVLMDIQMPVMDGYEATRTIRQYPHMHRLPIIATTANAMQSDKDASSAAGMNAHVAKPIDIDDLVNAILRCCDNARTVTQPEQEDNQNRTALDAAGGDLPENTL